MAIIADGMDLFHGFAIGNRFLQIMAIAAIFFLMTIHAPQTKQVNMLLMVKGYHGPLFIRSDV